MIKKLRTLALLILLTAVLLTGCALNEGETQAPALGETETFEELEYLTLGTLRKAVQEGDVKNGTVMAGQIAGLISKEQTCKEMIEEMMGQAEKLLGRC